MINNIDSSVKISFIIPAYNSEKYLDNCIDSIIKQNLNSFEVIIVNDGSNDNTLDVANKIQQKYPSIIKLYSKKNGGAASARNFGLKNCNGKYVIFVDSDDFIFGKDLKKCIQDMEGQNADILISDISLFEGNKIIRNEINQKNIFIQNDVLNYMSLLNKFPGSCCSKIFKLKFIHKNNLLFLEGIVNEDIDFMIKCFSKDPKVFHNNSSWYLYRQNVKGSVTNIIQSKNCIDMFRIIKELSSNNDISNKEALNRILCYEYSTLFFYYNRLQAKDKKDLKSKFKKYRYLLKKRFKKERIIYYIYNLCGLDLTALIVSLFYKLKRRILSGSI